MGSRIWKSKVYFATASYALKKLRYKLTYIGVFIVWKLFDLIFSVFQVPFL